VRDGVREGVTRIVAEYRPQAPVLEVGAYDINGTVRPLFPRPYRGLDLQAGPNVDIVADILTIDLAGGFKTVVCCETLEHICEPWAAIEQMYKALDSGGLLIATWCFAFPIHDHPADYFRCTPSGFKYLLERAGFYEIRVDAEGEGPAGVFAVARKT